MRWKKSAEDFEYMHMQVYQTSSSFPVLTTFKAILKPHTHEQMV